MLAAAIVGGGVAIAIADDSGGKRDLTVTESPDTQQSPTPASSSPTLDKQIRDAFNLFDAPAASFASLNSAMREFAADNSAVYLSLARIARTPGGNRLTVAPGDGLICIASDALAGCGSIQSAIAGNLVIVELCSSDRAPGQTRLIGLLPDGIERIEVGRDSGSSIPVAIADNVYEAVITGIPESISWHDGSHYYALPVPPNLDLAECSS